MVQILADYLQCHVNDSTSFPLSPASFGVVSEILKLVFNICTVPSVSKDKRAFHDELLQYSRIARCVVHILSATADDANTHQLKSHSVNLLMSTPADLVSVVVGGHNQLLDDLVKFLDRQLGVQENQSFSLSPILTLLRKWARANPAVRRRLKESLLPPRDNFEVRPEEGDSLRARLIKLMTSHNMEVKTHVAELLFVLCKEKVSRLISETGYGNAAGLLASHGLLGGEGGVADYSSDSAEEEEVETQAAEGKETRHLSEEEKKEMVASIWGASEETPKQATDEGPSKAAQKQPKPQPPPNINSVTGTVFKDSDPFAGMTEEEKEQEAEKLMLMFDRLNKLGIIK
eukprot:Colp12_sorted_trinity150504_noHs@25566